MLKANFTLAKQAFHIAKQYFTFRYAKHFTACSLSYVKLLSRSNAVWRKLSRHYLTGLRFQNFSAYSSIDLSAAKYPAAAVLSRDILVQFSRFWYAAIISSWVLR